jgi:hypothetical protein
MSVFSKIIKDVIYVNSQNVYNIEYTCIAIMVFTNGLQTITLLNDLLIVSIISFQYFSLL